MFSMRIDNATEADRYIVSDVPIIEGRFIPEPASVALLGLGGLSLLVVGWRRRRA